MQKSENCPHQSWVCIQSAGDMGELRTSTILSDDQVSLVKKDNTQAEIVCPHGNIKCAICGMQLFGGAIIDLPQVADIKASLKNLSPKPPNKNK